MIFLEVQYLLCMTGAMTGAMMSRDELQFYNNCTFSIFAIFSIPGVDPPCSLLALKYLVKPQQVLGEQGGK